MAATNFDLNIPAATEGSDSDEEALVFRRAPATNGSTQSGKAAAKPVVTLPVKPHGNSGKQDKEVAPKAASDTTKKSEAVKKTVPAVFRQESESDSEDDRPLVEKLSGGGKKRAAGKVQSAGPPAKKAKAPPPKPAVRAEESGSESDSKSDSKSDSRSDSKSDSESEEDVPLSMRQPAPTKKKVVTTKKVKVVVTKQGSKEGRGKEGESKRWSTLEHNGVIFPPPYKPHGVKMVYDGGKVELTPEQEEVATMFAVMRETDYAQKPVFRKNFWTDWKALLGPKHAIQMLDKCDFTPIWEWHAEEKERKKNMTGEDKKTMKEEKLGLEEKYMWAVVDGVREKVGNFRVEPPGLFRGRGEHPKMGKLKKRIFPENITINIGKEIKVLPVPLAGHRWKEVRHDNSVTWLAFWSDPINEKESKYVFLAASSALKGQSDKEKYEKARTLKQYILDIRKTYTRDFENKDMQKRQIAVATYLIDRLALRAGNEKDEDEADTVGCCSLKVSHVKLVPPRSLEFDFLGKDSMRYFNTVEVEALVFKAVGSFQKGKKGEEDLFDKLDTSKLNAHLKEIMPQLTAKVFRTYNASSTLDRLLQDTAGNSVMEKVAVYHRANKEVAILCNHQRTVSKAHEGQMEKLHEKLNKIKVARGERVQEELDRLQKEKSSSKKKSGGGGDKKPKIEEQLERQISVARERMRKMEIDIAQKEDLKTVALGTSKINYMDPRISIAWCKRHEVPLEKIFNKSLVAKFVWAMDVDPEFRF